MKIFARALAWTVAAFAAAGLIDGVSQFLAHPYWFASASDRFVCGVGLATRYAFAGLVAGILFGLALRTFLGDRRGEAIGAALLAALFWIAVRVHLDSVQGFFSATGIAVSAAVAAAAFLVILGIRRRRVPARGERKVLGIAAAIVVLVFAAAAFAGFRTGASRGGPNVLLLVIDTLRADHLACYGHPRATSRAIDRVAAEGALFVDAITPAPFTQPGVASILTGASPSTIGVINHPNRLDDRWTTVAEAFHDAGYRTGFANPHPLLTPTWGFAQGFDEYRYLHKPTRSDASLLARLLGRCGLSRPRVGYQADTVTEFAERLVGRKSGRPFFVYAHYLDPHFAYDPPAPFDRLFTSDRKKAPLLDERMPDGRRRIFDLPVAPRQMEAERARYDGEIAFADREIGRLLARLDELGLRENTIVAITADHGESLGEQGLTFAHTHYLYDSTQRVPLILRYPGHLTEGSVVTRQVSLVDLAPTLLRLAGIPVPPSMEGRVPPAAGGGAPDDPPLAFAENGRTIVGSGEQDNPRWYVPGDEGKWRMIRDGRWKLIRIPIQAGVMWELYDLENDPEEMSNLSVARPDAVGALRVPLEAWLESIRKEEAAAPIVDDETLEGLRSLGYIN